MTEAERIEIENRARHDQNNREMVLQMARELLSNPQASEKDRELATKALALIQEAPGNLKESSSV